MANEIMAKPIEKLTKKIHSDILCPFCMSELNRGEIIYKCPTCGKIVKQSAYEFATMKAPACYDPKCKKQIAKRYCKKCNNPLPFDILQYKKNLRFALIGIKGSGKTNYLTTMITEAKKTQATSLYLPDYPYEYEHFITEPLKGGEQMLYFREFYQIPENTELLFDPIDD